MKQAAKQWALHAIEAMGVNRFYRSRTQNRLLGLCYHGVIGDDAPWKDPRSWIAVSKSQFERQMRELRRHWRPISLSRLDTLLRSGEQIPSRSVFVTFDDGFLNNRTYAAPILKKYGIPATIFLTTGLIGTEQTVWALELLERIDSFSGKFISEPMENQEIPVPPSGTSERQCFAERLLAACKRLTVSRRTEFLEQLRRKTNWSPSSPWQKDLYRMLNWDDVKEMYKQGCEFGAHTVSHCNLATVSGKEAREELSASKEEIERQLGVECFSAAYPFGDAGAFSDSVVRITGDLGFRLAVTLCLKRNSMQPDPLRLDRICVTGDLSFASFQSLTSGWRNA